MDGEMAPEPYLCRLVRGTICGKFAGTLLLIPLSLFLGKLFSSLSLTSCGRREPCPDNPLSFRPLPLCKDRREDGPEAQPKLFGRLSFSCILFEGGVWLLFLLICGLSPFLENDVDNALKEVLDIEGESETRARG